MDQQNGLALALIHEGDAHAVRIEGLHGRSSCSCVTTLRSAHPYHLAP
jgi:hypothetical protein